MRIKKLILINFCRHKRLELSFDVGLIGVFGPNGSGKSTITDAMYAVLTNDFSRFSGTKEQNICDLAGPEEESSAYIEAEHEGLTFELYRALRKKRGTPEHSLIINGGKPIIKANDIQTELETRLGVNSQLIARYVFVRQWEMFSFLEQTSGQRAAAYQMLCGTGKAETIYDAIEELLKQDADLTVEIVDDSDDRRRKIAEVEGHLTKAQEDRAEAAKGLRDEKTVASGERIKLKRLRNTQFREEKAKLETQRNLRHKSLNDSTMVERTAAQRLADAEKALAAAKPKATAATGMLAKLEQAKSLQARQVTLQQQLTKLQNGKTLKPTLHTKDAARDSIYETAVSDKSVWEKNDTVLRTFDEDGVVECPTCGTPVAEMDAHLKSLRDAQPKLKAAYEEGYKLVSQIDKLRDVLRGWERAEQRRVSEVDSTKRQLETIAAVDIPDIDEASLRADITDQASCQTAVTQATRTHSEASKSKTQAETVLRETDRRLEELETQIKESEVSDELLAKVEKALREHTAATVQCEGHDSTIRFRTQQLAEEQAELDKLTARLDRNRKGRRFAAKLRILRESVFQKQQLPQMVAQANLEDLEHDMNEVLDAFGGPFWVSATQDLLFNVHFPGEPERSALRLSGGQKGVLALAFRRAICALFETDVGMMSLDEPTAGLDENNTRFMAEVLTRFAAEIRGKRQIIVITHADALKPAFDQVIDIGELSAA